MRLRAAAGAGKCGQLRTGQGRAGLETRNSRACCEGHFEVGACDALPGCEDF